MSEAIKSDESYYFMNHRNRGVALIFNHENFAMGSEHSRRGTNVDRDQLSACLEYLGFEIRIRNDLSCDQLKQEVKNVAAEDHSDNDCLVVAILSHGNVGIIHAYDKPYKLDDIWPNFTASRCPSLAGKPKLFFIQACQGENFDKGVTLRPRIETDGHSTEESNQICADVDFLIALSTVPDYFSFRNPKGSWFIQALCKELKTNGRRFDIVEILTVVMRQVAINYESRNPFKPEMDKKKQMPFFVSLLSRLLVFRDKPHVNS